MVPFAVDEYLIKLVISKWEGICLGSFESIKEDLKNLVSDLCKTHFKRFQSTGLVLDARFVWSFACR